MDMSLLQTKELTLKCVERIFGVLFPAVTLALYKDIIEPFGRTAKERNEELQLLIDAKLNLFTAEFVSKYCNQFGVINWELLVQDNSGSRAGSNKPW